MVWCSARCFSAGLLFLDGNRYPSQEDSFVQRWLPSPDVFNAAFECSPRALCTPLDARTASRRVIGSSCRRHDRRRRGIISAHVGRPLRSLFRAMGCKALQFDSELRRGPLRSEILWYHVGRDLGSKLIHCRWQIFRGGLAESDGRAFGRLRTRRCPGRSVPT